MPIVAIMAGPGITQEMYEALRPLVNWESQHPAGLILHSASFDEQGGIHVADIWDSAEDMGAFFETRLGPAFAQLNFPQIEPSIYPAHNINALVGIERYRI